MVERAMRPASGSEPVVPEEDLLAPGLVHELNQPLTGLDAALRLVARELGPAVTQLDAWSIATSELGRLRETLETYHRLMSGSGADPAPFEVEPIVRRAADALRHRSSPDLHRPAERGWGGGAGAATDAISVVVEPDVPLAYGNPHALLHAVTNVLANAVHAVAETRRPGRIEVRVVRVADPAPRAQVRIADEGTGIPPSRRRELFRAGYTSKAPGRGSGLGLAVSRRMLRHSGGELRLAAPGDPAGRAWSATEFVVDLLPSARAAVPLAPAVPAAPGWRARAWRVAPFVAAVAALALGLGLGWSGFRRWVRSGDAARESPVAAAAAPVTVEVLSAEGRIERRRGARWEPVARGERLQPDDTIRAGAGSGATLAVGDRSRLVISDATELTVREITAAVHRLRLSRGRISVDHQADGARVLVVESERGDSVAQAGTARFSVLASGAALAVATNAGVVRLKSAGEAVDVGAGEQSVTFAGRAPSRPGPIPVALILKIARAAADRAGTCLVEGVAEAGAEVRVEGRPVEPGPGGRFAIRVPARAGSAGGRSLATIVTRDAAGRIVERRVACGGDEPAVSEFAVRWGQDAPAPKR